MYGGGGGEKCQTFDKLECLFSYLLAEQVENISEVYLKDIFQHIYCSYISTSIHGPSPVPARRGGGGIYD